jgi:hypothetical protein
MEIRGSARMLFYLFIALYIAAAAAPVVLAVRGRALGICFATGWMSLLVVERGFAELSFLFPRAFGLQASQVQSPDAPDVLPALLVSLLIACVTTLLGQVVVLCLPRRRRRIS